MTKKQRIEKLKARVLSENFQTQKWACHDLFYFGGRFNKTARRKLRQYLVNLFDQDNSGARSAVALVVRENRYQPALRPLLRAMLKPENSRNRGALAYALETLDCSKHLCELFEIVFSAPSNYVTLVHTLTVLEEQPFRMNNDKLHQIARRWEETNQPGTR